METFLILTEATGKVFLNFSPIIPMFILWVYFTEE